MNQKSLDKMYDIVIKNGYIYDVINNKIIKKEIAIKDNLIILSDVTNQGRKVIDATNKIILPGFINTHIHFGEYYAKGYDKKFTTEEYIDYTENFNFQNKSFKEQIRQTSTKLAAYEALKYGSTTLMGIRGWDSIDDFRSRLYLGYPLMKSEKLKKYLIKPFENFEKLINTDLNNHYIFLHSIQTVDETILSNLSEYLKEKNIKLAVHTSETKKENDFVKQKYQKTPVELLEHYNLLNKNTLLVHCCYINDKDITIIKKHQCTICICPNSNLKLKNQIAPIKQIIKKGINICLGTDGAATNDSLNIIDSLKTVGLITDLNSGELIKMITLNPNKYLKNNSGKIENQMLADLIIYDLNDYRIVRKETFINNLIYSSAILPEYVIINGKIIFENFKSEFLQEKDLKKLSDQLDFD